MRPVVCMLLVIVSTGCNSLDPRMKDHVSLQNVKRVRRAEKEFLEVKGRYGTLEELGQLKLIPEGLRDGSDNGYSFELKTDGASYSVNADPLPDPGQIHNHFFMDETGVIRASNDAAKRADKQSDAISSQ